MSQQVLVNAKLWLAGYDFTGDLNALALKYGADMVENTALGAASRSRLPGLQSYSFSHAGFWDGGAGNTDDAIWNTAFAVANSVMSCDPMSSGTEGDVAYTGQFDLAQYSPGAKVGAMFGFTVAGESDNQNAPLVRGTLLANRTVTLTGNGSVFNLGAVGAAQKIYAGLHVIAPVTGTTPSLTVALQSAPTVGFAAPTTRITFNAATGIGAQWGSAAGAITDAFWRVSYTVSGTTPSIPFVLVAGIR